MIEESFRFQKYPEHQFLALSGWQLIKNLLRQVFRSIDKTLSSSQAL